MAIKSIFDDELILPGVITEIVNDYIAGYDTSEFGSTDAVTIVGTAFNGPVGVPVPVFSPEYAKYMFGEAFDAATRREATLVPEIYDAWERGCRTIYAVRVSGKDMYKDYELAIESDLMLRVSGQFPCNDNKKCFMLLDAKQTEQNPGVIKIFKPADRTTVQEKLQGVVNNVNSILVAEIKLEENGITKSSRLVDLIDKVNKLDNNNVITLSIVNKDGVVITEADKDVQMLSVGDMFPGIYTLCRDKVGENINPKTNVEIVRVKDGQNKLHSASNDMLWKRLNINTDVRQPFPIHAEVFDNFKNSVDEIVVDAEFEFLKKIGLIDRIAVVDDIDYEEVELEPFDLYCRLGKGFVKQAKIKKLAEGKYKVVQPDDNDVNRIVGINDGIYSILENHRSDYIVLAGVSAETVISGSLPKRNDFRIVDPEIIKLKDSEGKDLVSVNCLLDAQDFNHVIEYDIAVMSKELDQDAILDGMMEDQRFMRMAVVDLADVQQGAAFEGVQADTFALALDAANAVQDGENIKVPGQLVRYNGKAFEVLEDQDALKISDKDNVMLIVQIGNALVAYGRQDDAWEVKELEAGKYLIASSGSVSNVYLVSNALVEGQLVQDENGVALVDENEDVLVYEGAEAGIVPVISLKDLSEGVLKDEDYTIACVESGIPALKSSLSNNSTLVLINSTVLEYSSAEEIIDDINAKKQIAGLFKFEAENGSEELVAVQGHGLNRKEELSFDEDMYIPYTTSDNFARHLAQHCLYTQLKTYPTHGVIGCAKLSGINLSTIAQRVNEICSFDFDLYAKKDNGNYMLDSDNQPYPIGRCLSITFMQHNVGTGSGYNYVSNGAAGYAGMISQLPIERSSTNQPINIEAASFELSNYQLGRLNSKGIVCCKNTTNNGVVVVDGITQAPKTSAYRRLSTSKTINTVDRILRNAIEPYIGLVDSLSTRNSLNTSIKSVLSDLKDVIINDFKFKIYTDSSGGNLGVIRIDYVIVPLNEIREVRNRVEISDAI